jgi:hypothetical protein
MEPTRKPKASDSRRSYWQSHIEGWQHSGLSQHEYCRQHYLSLSSFGYWRSRLKVREQSGPRFHPVVIAGKHPPPVPEPPAEDSGLRVVLPHHHFSIAISSRFCPTTLKAVLGVLEEVQ